MTYVVGEFYWRVAVGESCLVEDYICPPKMPSREVTDKEASWSESAYLDREDLRARSRSPRRRRSAKAFMPISRIPTPTGKYSGVFSLY